MDSGRVVMGLLFFPRGGSAQVTRYLGAALRRSGREVALVTGSLGPPGAATHAPTFFGDLDVHPLDFTAAVDEHRAGRSALLAPVPMHPSYEDRVGAPDPVLAAVDPSELGHLAAVWEAPFVAAGAGAASVLHLHHLTPQLDMAVRRWPSAPVVAHLHGTELNFLGDVEDAMALASRLGRTLATMPDDAASGPSLDTAAVDTTGLAPEQLERLRATRWSQWRHGEFWRGHLRHQAALADHLVVVSPPDRATAVRLLGVDGAKVTAVPNGVDIDRFRPRPLDAGERRAWFRHWLVEDPQGWDEGGVPGSVAYREADLDRLLGDDGGRTVLVYVGRFTAAKRVPLLVRAFARARARSAAPLSLVIWGGHPGEWEGDHPVAVAREVGEDGLFFAGWRGHQDLPDGLAACDALVMPSVNDSFAQTALEAMAVGRPVLATLSGGFPAMINLDAAHPTGWLVPPDDLDALTDAMVEIADRPDERERRSCAALAHARAHLSWDRRVDVIEHVYELARRHHLDRAARAGRG